MVQIYSTEVKNTTKSLHSYEPHNQQVGFKTSIRSEKPMFAGGCDTTQIYNIISTDTPLHVSGIRKRAVDICRGSREKQTNILPLIHTGDTINPAEYFSKLRELSNQYYYTRDMNPYRDAAKYAARLKDDYIAPLKQLLPCIIFSANTLEHTTEAVTATFNGVIQFDIDYHYYKGDRDAQALQELLRSDPYVHAAFISPSGFGLKIQFITDNPAEQYEATRDAFSKYLTDQYQVEPTATRYGQKINIIDKLPIGQTCYISYDPDIYTNYEAAPFNETFIEPTNVKEKQTYNSHTAVNIPTSEAKQIIEQIIEQVERQQIDITSGAKWYRIGFAIAHHFGEAGRTYFHKLSQYHPHYKTRETNSQYNACLRTKTPNTPVTIATVIKYAQDAGIKVKTANKVDVIEYDQVITVDEYVSEAAPEILEAIETHPKIVLVSSTGAGKTQATFNDILPRLEGNAIVSLPYIANVKQASQRFNCGALHGVMDFCEINDAFQNNITAATYNKATMYVCDTLVVDEVHNLIGQYNFRGEDIESVHQAANAAKNIIMMTATPSPMFKNEGYYFIKIETRTQPKQKLNIIPYTDKKKASTIVLMEAIRTLEAGKKALIKHKNKQILKDVLSQLKQMYPDKYIDVLDADNKEDNDTTEAIQSGCFPFDVLLSTNVINDGISIDRDFVDRIISVENQYNPSANDLIQFNGRGRIDPDKVEYICYYLQAGKEKQRQPANVRNLYRMFKNEAENSCDLLNETIQPGEDADDGEALNRIGNYNNHIILNRETNIFEPSTNAIMFTVEQAYNRSLTLENFAKHIESNHPHITVEIKNKFNIETDAALQEINELNKKQKADDQKEIYQFIKDGHAFSMQEYVCKNSRDIGLTKRIRKHFDVDRSITLSDETQEFSIEHENLLQRAFDTLETVSQRLCTCARYGIESPENIIFDEDHTLKHGASFNRIIDNIANHLVSTYERSDLNRESKHAQTTVNKALEALDNVKIPKTMKQIQTTITAALKDEKVTYFDTVGRVSNFVKAFYKLKRYQGEKNKKYHTIGARLTLEQYAEKIHIIVNFVPESKTARLRPKLLSISDGLGTLNNSLRTKDKLAGFFPHELPPTRKVKTAQIPA